MGTFWDMPQNTVIWTIVGILAIIALLIFVFNALSGA
jgi:uncharacterized membrane protein